MSNEELIARYRNLLIALARAHLSSVDYAKAIFDGANMEQNRGRRAGLIVIYRTALKSAEFYNQLLGRNKAALRHFFHTTDAKQIATENEIILHRPSSADTINSTAVCQNPSPLPTHH